MANGSVSRTWLWGPTPITQIQEPYAEAPGGQRTVVYYDKARMEDNSYRASAPWDVTTGLLAKDLILGQRQTGDNQFERHLPAEIPVAGDFNDPNGPRYRSFKGLLGYQPVPVDWAITQTVDRFGRVANDPSLGSHGVTAARLITETNHALSSVFASFLDTYSGQPYGNVYYLTGFPITEAYWATVRVGGVDKQVLIQAFERRVLTFTPENPAGWQVEMGNVGQHYYEWLYGAMTPGPTDHVLPVPTLSQIVRQKHLTVATTVIPGLFGDHEYVTMATDIANKIQIAGVIQSEGIFQDFRWANVLNDWDSVNTQLQQGVIPFDSDLNWDPGAEELLALARQSNTSVIGFQLFWAGDIPASLHDGNFNSKFPPQDIRKLIQYMVQAKVLKYPDIPEWGAVNEITPGMLFNDPQWTFWFRATGGNDQSAHKQLVKDVLHWAHEANPNAKLCWYENNILDGNTAPAFVQANTFTLAFLDELLREGVPLHRIADEGNFWIYAPPDEQFVQSTLEMLLAKGVYIGPSQMTVAESDQYPFWTGRPKAVEYVADKDQAKKNIYDTISRIYFELETQHGTGSVQYGAYEFWEKYSMFSIPPLNSPTANALIIDAAGSPTPSYDAILKNADSV